MLGVLLGGAVAQELGYRTMFALAAVLAVAGTLCAWRMVVLEPPGRAAKA